METGSAHSQENGRGSWAAALVAVLPLVAFALVSVMDGTMGRLAGVAPWSFLIPPLWADALRIAAVPVVFYLLLLAGLLAAWLEGFPRWSFPYLGWLLVFLVGSLGLGGLYAYVLQISGPLLVTLLVAAVLRPSLDPLRSLARAWKQDWTLSILAVLGILQFLNTFDEMPGPAWAQPFWLLACTTVLVLGVVGYLRLPDRRGRVAALLGGAVLSVVLGVTVRAYYWGGLADTIVGWCVWLTVLSLPAVLAAVAGRHMPSGPAGQQSEPGRQATKKALYLLALLAWALISLHLARGMFGAPASGLLIFALPIGAWLLLPLLAVAATRVSYAVWIGAGFLLVAAQFLPAPLLSGLLAPGNPLPLDSVAPAAILVFALALVVVALLLHAGLTLLGKRQDSGIVGDEGAQAQRNREGWAAAVAIALSALLLAKTLHSFYWFMFWDTTGDGLDRLWLVFPILTVLCLSGVLAIVLPGRKKWAGLFYLLLIPALLGVYALTERVGTFEFTEARAQYVAQALDAYYAREGHYPQNLRQLTPRITLSLPEPLIIYGQGWCYDAGDTYYRLGTVYREHWSSPDLVGQLYSAKGDLPDLPPLCDQELSAFRAYDSMYR